MPSPDERNRRVTDKQIPIGMAEQAVRMERLEGQHALLQAQVKSSVDNMANALAANASEVRAATARFGEIANIQHAHESNTAAIRRIEESTSANGRKLDDWFKNFEDKQSERWQHYQENRDRWRETHESLNVETKADLIKMIVEVEKSTIRILAWSGGAGLLVAALVGGFLWYLNGRFNNNEVAVVEARALAAETANRVNAVANTNIEKIHNIELYLARGGEKRDIDFEPTGKTK